MKLSYPAFFTLLIIGFLIESSHARECPEGFYPVKSHPRNSYHKHDGTPVSGAVVKEQCRPYRVLRKPVPMFLSEMPSGWPNLRERFKPWTKNEVSRIKEVIETLPAKLTHFGEIRFHRATSDIQSPNPTVSNSENKIITIYDSVSSHSLKRVIAHELAHLLWDSLSGNEQADFLVPAKWVMDKELRVVRLQRSNIAIPDSATGPGEDFANSVELFLTEKDKLKAEPEILGCLERMIQ